MSSKWIKKGDLVSVIAGSCKGERGKVLLIKGDKIFVEGVNKKVKSIKKSEKYPSGGLIKIEGPIHISNICLCDDSGEKIKLHVQVSESGSKVLVYEKGGDQKVFRVLKKKQGAVLDVTS